MDDESDFLFYVAILLIILFSILLWTLKIYALKKMLIEKNTETQIIYVLEGE